MILYIFLSSLLGVMFLSVITYELNDFIRRLSFKQKLSVGSTIIHHYIKDDFTPMTDEVYTIIDISKKQVKLKSEHGYEFVRNIWLMDPYDYTILTERNHENDRKISDKC